MLGVVSRQPEETAEQDQQDLETSGRKRGRSTGGASTASKRHIQTEQRRRDKINEGCVAKMQPVWQSSVLNSSKGFCRSIHFTHTYLNFLEIKGNAIR